VRQGCRGNRDFKPEKKSRGYRFFGFYYYSTKMREMEIHGGQKRDMAKSGGEK
jgi:hypothetical protein